MNSDLNNIPDEFVDITHMLDETTTKTTIETTPNTLSTKTDSSSNQEYHLQISGKNNSIKMFLKTASNIPGEVIDKQIEKRKLLNDKKINKEIRKLKEEVRNLEGLLSGQQATLRGRISDYGEKSTKVNETEEEIKEISHQITERKKLIKQKETSLENTEPKTFTDKLLDTGSKATTKFEKKIAEAPAALKNTSQTIKKIRGKVASAMDIPGKIEDKLVDGVSATITKLGDSRVGRVIDKTLDKVDSSIDAVSHKFKEVMSTSPKENLQHTAAFFEKMSRPDKFHVEGHLKKHLITKSDGSASLKIKDVQEKALDPAIALDKETSITFSPSEKKDPESSKTIRSEFKYKGVTYGSEVAIRPDTLGPTGKSLTKQIELYENQIQIGDKISSLEETNQRLEELTGLPDEQITRDIETLKKESEIFKNNPDVVKKTAILKKNLAICKKALESNQKSQNENKTWCNSNFFRDRLTEGIKKLPDDASGFGDLIDSSVSTSLINLRYQKALSPNGSKIGGFARCGVITDLRNGFTSLPELKEMLKNRTAHETKLAELEQLKEEFEAKGDSIKAASVGYAIKQINDLENTIIEREFILKQQMLQLIELQASENIESINNGTFAIVHELLLNPETNKVDKTGWGHNEGNQIRDMGAAFEMFKDAKITFIDDPNIPPHFDENGSIVMSKPKGVKKNTATINDAFILNNSPQISSIKNFFQNIFKKDRGGLQETLNAQNFPRLENLILNSSTASYADKTQALAKLTQLKKAHEKGLSNYKTGELLAEVLSLAKIPHSIGCLSAKDRTGVIGGQAICNMFKNCSWDSFSFTQLPADALAFFKSDILNQDGVAIGIADENTGADSLKVITINLPGVKITSIAQNFFKTAVDMTKKKAETKT